MLQQAEVLQPPANTLTSRRVLVIGPPGAGKGTQCAILRNRYGCNHISTGQLLRDTIAADTGLGRAVKRYVDEGFLVPDRLVLRLLVDHIRLLAEATASPGFLLDGVPRTISQAQALDVLMASGQVDTVLHLQVPDIVALARSRRSGRDDGPRRSAHRRLEAYRAFTVPMVAWMVGTRPVFTVDANRPIDDVAATVVACLTSRDLARRESP
jgi:adenylate kinase